MFSSSPSSSTTIAISKFSGYKALLFVLILILGTSYIFSTPQSSSTRMRKQLTRSTLVMVPGHGIFLNHQWILSPWLIPSKPDIEEQIKASLTKYANNKKYVVVYSGGQTHSEIGKISEAQSYLDAAKYLELRNTDQVVLEEYARDSFENVLFSICRFKQVMNHYPEEVIVLGFEFKRERFENEHRKAIFFPKEKFHYLGVSAPNSLINHEQQLAMERKITIPQFQNDPYGCQAPLSTKKIERNPFGQRHLYHSSCPELIPLLNACQQQPNQISAFSKNAPW